MNSRATISSDIFAWKMSGEHAMPICSHWLEYFPQKNNAAYFGQTRVQSDGVIAHVQVKGCHIREHFQILQNCTDLGDWKWVSHYSFVYFPKITKELQFDTVLVL